MPEIFSELANFNEMWNKKPTRCHLVLYLFLIYKLLNMFRATLCPSSGADDLVVFLPYVAQRATYYPMDTQPANQIWPPTQPRHYTTRGKNTTKSSAPEYGHKVARNMLSNL